MDFELDLKDQTTLDWLKNRKLPNVHSNWLNNSALFAKSLDNFLAVEIEFS